MRIAILGSGGVGGYFGGRLAASGCDVSFIARGQHLAALQQRGLRIESPLGDLELPRVNATDDTASVGPVEVVFFTVKLYDSDSAARMLPPLLGPSTVVVSFQNGVEAISILTRGISRKQVAGGTTYVSAQITDPGVIRHIAMNELIFGPLEPSQTARLEALRDACRKAGIEATLSDRVLVDIWAKFARLSVFSGMTSITRSSIGPIMNDPELLEMTEAALHESIAVARGKQVPVTHHLYADIMDALRGVPPETKSSMLLDLERGRRLELPWLSGAVVRLGRDVGVNTPVHRMITAILRPHVHGQ